MAYKIDGMNVSYDYSELIMELKSDVAEGLLDTSSIINIVRKPNPKFKEINYNLNDSYRKIRRLIV